MHLLPERDTIEKRIEELSKQWENEILKMREEYNTKITEFQQKQDSMPASIKEMRMREIQEIEQRISTIQQTAYNDLQQRQQQMLNPVIEKVRKAISEVAVEGNYTYIFDLSALSILYQSPKSNDITVGVKKKLGLK
jgi:outer membrane protein